MWSRVRNWFVAPFAPRVEQRVAAVRRRVPVTRSEINVPVATQASAFLDWLQSEGGSTGEILSRELMIMYWDMCIENNWKILHWQRVAHEFSALIGGGSRVKSVEGKKQRVWTVPQRVAQRVVGGGRYVQTPRQRVLGPMVTHVEAA